MSMKSRCRKDPNYEPSKLVIRSPQAMHLLDTAVKKTTVYKFPRDFIYARDTFYVESFNNVLNIFHDKRICFGDESYKMRTALAIIHWNENVDRCSTSVHEYETGKTQKVLVHRTLNYRHAIWRRFMELLEG